MPLDQLRAALPGLVIRPAVAADAPAVTALIAACERETQGEVDITDDLTGGVDLYLAVGMNVRRSYTRWTFDLAEQTPS